MRNQYGLRVWTSMRKTLDNDDLNRVGRPAVLVKTRVWAGCLVSRAHKTWSRSFLLQDFPLMRGAGKECSCAVSPPG